MKILAGILIIIFINIYFLVLCASRLYLVDLIYLDVILIFVLLLAIGYDFYKFYRLTKQVEALQHIEVAELTNLVTPPIINLIEKNNQYYDHQLNYLTNQIQDLVDYISKWVHEVKLPLAALRLMNERLQDQGLKKDMRATIEKIQQLLNTMLMSSKLRNPENDFKIERIRLNQVIKEAVKHQSYFLINQHFEIILDMDDIYVYCDRRWLTYMLDQFISNSIKYRSSKQPRLIFKVADNQKNTLIIEDNGIGIKEIDLPYIFDRGFVGSNLRDGDYRSTGMGLYFVKDIAKRLNIDVKVDATYNNGTRFLLIFNDNREYFILD